jgi:hypothetical protein
MYSYKLKYSKYYSRKNSIHYYFEILFLWLIFYVNKIKLNFYNKKSKSYIVWEKFESLYWFQRGKNYYYLLPQKREFFTISLLSLLKIKKEKN